MIWGSGDLPKDVAAPQAVPRTPFFLRSTHRCLLADPAQAMAVVVDALIEMDCDVSMESPEPSVSTFPASLSVPLALQGAWRAHLEATGSRPGAGATASTRLVRRLFAGIIEISVRDTSCRLL